MTMLVEGCKVLIKMETVLRSVVKVVSAMFRNVFHYKIQEMYERGVEEDPHMLDSVPDQYKTQEICERAVQKKSHRKIALTYIPE